MRFAFKKPTHPTPNCSFSDSIPYHILVLFSIQPMIPSKFLGSDSPAVLVLYSVVISASTCAQLQAFQASGLSPPSRRFCIRRSSRFVTSLGLLVVTMSACCSAFLTTCELFTLTGGLRSICQFYQRFNQINLLVDASKTNNSSKRKRKIN